MKARFPLHNRVVAAILSLLLALPAAAQDSAKVDGLLDRLKTAEAPEAGRIEREIWLEWSKSGSAPMDLLLQRGRDALDAGETDKAIAHFTALTDHAPDFAEGWNGRATAYFVSGRIGPSVADLGRALTLNPRHFGAMSGLATILEQVGKPTEALEVWRQAKAIHPHLAGVDETIERLERDAQGQEL